MLLRIFKSNKNEVVILDYSWEWEYWTISWSLAQIDQYSNISAIMKVDNDVCRSIWRQDGVKQWLYDQYWFLPAAPLSMSWRLRSKLNSNAASTSNTEQNSSKCNAGRRRKETSLQASNLPCRLIAAIVARRKLLCIRSHDWWYARRALVTWSDSYHVPYPRGITWRRDSVHLTMKEMVFNGIKEIKYTQHSR